MIAYLVTLWQSFVVVVAEEAALADEPAEKAATDATK